MEKPEAGSTAVCSIAFVVGTGLWVTVEGVNSVELDWGVLVTCLSPAVGLVGVVTVRVELLTSVVEEGSLPPELVTVFWEGGGSPTDPWDGVTVLFSAAREPADVAATVTTLLYSDTVSVALAGSSLELMVSLWAGW